MVILVILGGSAFLMGKIPLYPCTYLGPGVASTTTLLHLLDSASDMQPPPFSRNKHLTNHTFGFHTPYRDYSKLRSPPPLGQYFAPRSSPI